MTDEFFHEEMASRPMNNAFEMNGLNHELERIQMPPSQQQVVHHQRQQVPTPDWANDFMQVNQPQQQQQQFDDFEGVYQKSQPQLHQQPQPMHQMQMNHFPMIQGEFK
jgi:hypothetical protein